MFFSLCVWFCTVQCTQDVISTRSVNREILCAFVAVQAGCRGPVWKDRSALWSWHPLWGFKTSKGLDLNSCLWRINPGLPALFPPRQDPPQPLSSGTLHRHNRVLSLGFHGWDVSKSIHLLKVVFVLIYFWFKTTQTDTKRVLSEDHIECFQMFD